MKTVAVIILFSASLCFAQQASDITTNISQRLGADGKPDVRIETVRRGQTKVLVILQTRDKGGVMATTRSYLVGGKLEMIESDKNGDGIFETMVLYTPDQSEMEVFKRRHDGTVMPVSTAALAIYKKQNELMETDVQPAIRDYFDGKIDIEQLEKRALQTREKVQALEKQKQELEKDDQK